MKYEVGKYYRNRDGEKVKVIANFEEELGLASPIISLRKMEDCYDNHFSNGCVMKGISHRHDLMEEWREPIKVEGWVNIYKHGSDLNNGVWTRLFLTREDADFLSDSVKLTRLACIKVSGVEGTEN